ncbi:GDP-mannose 4,6-dehydratase [Danxiaibacter flavus]|uniref:GDP-mannose 4,6-dehydratase n=1 Tax=Danxiaibacter flavus TaxID=3049108 RepID=A0ABV3ZCY5_9BACT|nr:GDP-mannose 4,6-dehydratase [Chitinophagaceae bacterium DXS]
MRTAVIFGANGQDGYYLSELLQNEAVEVIAIGRNNASGVDISNLDDVKALVKEYKPDHIFHLAANSTTRHDTLFENHSTISTGTLNILEAVKSHSPLTKVFISGSGLQFKNRDLPIKETDEFEARDAYSVCRIQSVYAARYFRMLGIKAYVGYFFNHDSPRRTSRHVAQMIAADVLAIEKGEEKIITIGDPSVKKEWGFAGDIVKAIWTLVEQDEVFEANLGTGLGYSIQEYIETCFDIINKDWKNHVQLKDGFKADYRQLISDPSTILSLGWKPETSFEALTKMMLHK